jgi:hypothetical protein
MCGEVYGLRIFLNKNAWLLLIFAMLTSVALQFSEKDWQPEESLFCNFEEYEWLKQIVSQLLLRERQDIRSGLGHMRWHKRRLNVYPEVRGQTHGVERWLVVWVYRTNHYVFLSLCNLIAGENWHLVAIGLVLYLDFWIEFIINRKQTPSVCHIYRTFKIRTAQWRYCLWVHKVLQYVLATTRSAHVVF